MQLPQSQNDTKIFYSDQITHFDGLIPYSIFLTETNLPNVYHYKFTYHDGRVSSAESFDATGAKAGAFVVWNNSAGAPVLGAFQNLNGGYNWFEYGEYDSSGKIQTIYRYNDSFELQSYKVFSYHDGVADILDYRADSQLQNGTVFENGTLYTLQNGQKIPARRVIDRKQAICSLEKYGLKPFYPNY